MLSITSRADVHCEKIIILSQIPLWSRCARCLFTIRNNSAVLELWGHEALVELVDIALVGIGIELAALVELVAFVELVGFGKHKGCIAQVGHSIVFAPQLSHMGCCSHCMNGTMASRPSLFCAK